MLPGGLPHCGLVCWCVGGVFPEVPPVCGLVVFVSWRVGVDVCVFLLGAVAPCGLVVLVGWWCVGGVLPGGIAPLWVGGWGVGVVVSMYVCVAWRLMPPWCVWCVGCLVVWWLVVCVVCVVCGLVCWCLRCVA